MPRGRTDGDESRWDALGKQVKSEILSAIQLLLRNAKQHSISLLGSEPLWTSYQVNFRIRNGRLPFSIKDAAVSPDVVSRLKQMGAWNPVALLTPNSIKIRQGIGVRPDSVHLKSLPLFQPNPQNQHNLSLSIPVPLTASVQILKFTGNNGHWPIPTSSTTMKRILAGFMGNRRVISLGAKLKPGTILKNGSRFKSLPIEKTAIPMHRFNHTYRQIFRVCLAEKYKLSSENIQVVSAFPKISLRQYSALDRSEKGHLLCTPKVNSNPLRNSSDILSAAPTTSLKPSRQRLSTPNRPSINENISESDIEEAQSYLVIGLRLDTKQEIHTVVPFSKIKDSITNTLRPNLYSSETSPSLGREDQGIGSIKPEPGES